MVLKKLIITLALVSLLVGSALGIVFSTHIARQQFITLTKLQEKRDQLERSWSQLLLEESYWGSPSRVEKIARQKLGMKMPSSEDIRVVR